jgi:tRNA(Ser,Leu) C12 N-acetylase TAN1
MNYNNEQIIQLHSNSVKSEFIIPQPKAGEHKQAYISRCIAKIAKEYDKPGQAYAVCVGQLKK